MYQVPVSEETIRKLRHLLLPHPILPEIVVKKTKKNISSHYLSTF